MARCSLSNALDRSVISALTEQSRVTARCAHNSKRSSITPLNAISNGDINQTRVTPSQTAIERPAKRGTVGTSAVRRCCRMNVKKTKTSRCCHPASTFDRFRALITPVRRQRTAKHERSQTVGRNHRPHFSPNHRQPSHRHTS